ETVTMTTRHVMEVIGSPFKIELFHLSDDPHDQERFRRRRRERAYGREVSLPTPEDVIVTKLRWTQRSLRRSKDWDDVRDVIAVQGDGIDYRAPPRLFFRQRGSSTNRLPARIRLPP